MGLNESTNVNSKRSHHAHTKKKRLMQVGAKMVQRQTISKKLSKN
jgi:hypothetical protein